MDELEKVLERWSGIRSLIIKLAVELVDHPDQRIRDEMRQLLRTEEKCRQLMEAAMLKRYL